MSSGHAYSTVTEVAREASYKGLRAVAVLDHGPALPGGASEYYFSNLNILPDFIEGVRIIKGAEANILSQSGELDISDITLANLEFVGISLHPGCGYEPQGLVKNTEAVIKALERPNVRMICHPTIPEYEVDLKVVVQVAIEMGVIIELNNHSFNAKSYRAPALEDNFKLLELCAEYECPISVNSDAHFHELVGEVGRALWAIKKVGFPEELIVNTSLEKVESFLHRFNIVKLTAKDGEQ